MSSTSRSSGPTSSNLAGVVDGVPERFVPEEMRGELVEAEHIVRYWWATRFCSGRRVLDAGCGMGYGSAMLSEGGAGEVTAVDISAPVLEVARQAVPQSVRCEVADVASLPYANQSFDLIACFETIEHVDDPDAVLDELARVLAPDGLLLISSPNRARYVPGNPHHRHEYLPDELRAALARRFAEVRMLSQHAMVASVVSAEPATFEDGPVPVRRLIDPEQRDEVYTLAIAGDTMPDPGPPMVALTQFFEVRRWFEHYEQQQRMLGEQNELLSEYAAVRFERNKALSLLSSREQALSQQVELQARVAELEARCRAVEKLTRSFSWRITAPLRWVKELLLAPVRPLEKLVTERAKRLAKELLAEWRRAG